MANRNYRPMPTEIGKDDIGGALITKRFTMRGVVRSPGDGILTREDVLSLPTANFKALRDGGYISVFPSPRSGILDDVKMKPDIKIEPVKNNLAFKRNQLDDRARDTI